MVESLQLGPLGRRSVPAVRRRLVAWMIYVEAGAAGRMMIELRLFRQARRCVRRRGI